MGVLLQLKDVSLQYPKGARVFSCLNLDLEPSSSLAVLGPSGCGKTSLLNLISGLLRPSEGQVLLDNNSLDGPRRNTAYILQSYGLMPWKTVFDNVIFGLKLRGVKKEQAQLKAQEMIERLGLSGKEHSYPYQLSGGQKQRVALARSLSLDIDLLLLDEPLSALDPFLRQDLQELLLGLHRDYAYTQVVVTHSVEEALLLGQKLIVLSGLPASVHAHYENPFYGLSDLELKQDQEKLRSYIELKSEIMCLLTKLNTNNPLLEDGGGDICE